MNIDAEDFRRQYASLNDEALLEMNRDDLVPMAQQCYDVELSARGLDKRSSKNEESDAAAEDTFKDWIDLAVFDDAVEAGIARSILRLHNIPCIFSSELPFVRPVVVGCSILVPSEFADQAEEILDSTVSDAELVAQAEAATYEEDAEKEVEELI